ncbi:MAG: cell division topological specificity factor MinE [Oleispira sp.]|nr:cell division topological specificity factor MinE [Oleispira sp.]
MSLMDYFRKEQTNSASIAKERLQILVAHDRVNSRGPDYLPKMQQELLSVVRKYIAISDDQVQVNVEQQGTTSVLELNVMLPEG